MPKACLSYFFFYYSSAIFVYLFVNLSTNFEIPFFYTYESHISHLFVLCLSLLYLTDLKGLINQININNACCNWPQKNTRFLDSWILLLKHWCVSSLSGLLLAWQVFTPICLLLKLPQTKMWVQTDVLKMQAYMLYTKYFFPSFFSNFCCFMYEHLDVGFCSLAALQIGYMSFFNSLLLHLFF